MLIFMPIGLKLWALEGYTQTAGQTDKPSCYNDIYDNVVNKLLFSLLGHYKL